MKNDKEKQKDIDATAAWLMKQYTLAVQEVLQSEADDEEMPEELDKKCRELIKKEVKRQRYKQIAGKVGRFTCAAMLTVVMLFGVVGILFTTVEAVRAPIIRFFIAQKKGHLEITDSGEESDTRALTNTADFSEMNARLAALLPEGYVQTGENVSNAEIMVSTKQDEQLNSYEVQRTHYEERIRTEQKWSLVGIFADKGITGTSMKKRDEFNKMLRLCYKGKIDMIIVKSISRFARNTLDVIKITRKLREINVDVYFEEQGIHSIDPASEFYITIYGSIAQSESENISANVKWGKAQSAKQGNVPFQCKHFLGYTKNADGEIEIVPDEAEIIREIYERYLSGESLYGIKCYLEAKEIPTPAGCSVWRQETIRSILSNEKYKGDAIINKTYVSDCISKRVKVNNGERNKYYIENNHPAIIDAGTFARVQEEIARRSGKPKVKQKGTKTELSRYSSKYALSELLICGECRTPYRRCSWTAKGKRKVVWRCINRLDYGKKYCHHSPSIEESLLQDAVMRAIMQTAKQNIEVLKTLKIHIGMGLTDEVSEDKTLDIQIRIAEIDAEFQKMLKAVSADNADGIDEERITELMNEKQRLTVQLEQYAAMRQKRESAKSRRDEIFTILDGLQNHPMEYNDRLRWDHRFRKRPAVQMPLCLLFS